MQQLLEGTSSQTQRLGPGNQKGSRTGMRKRRITDGEEKEGEEGEEVVAVDLEEEIEATAEEEEIEVVIEVIEEETVAEERGSMMTGGRTEEMIGSMRTGVIEVTGHVEGTEAVVRMEHVVVVATEAVVGLKEDVVDPGVEDRMGTVIRQHINQV